MNANPGNAVVEAISHEMAVFKRHLGAKMGIDLLSIPIKGCERPSVCVQLLSLLYVVCSAVIVLRLRDRT